MKQYNEGGVTLHEAYEIARAEAVETGADVEFEFALVRVTVNAKSNFTEVGDKWAEGVRRISYTTKQL